MRGTGQKVWIALLAGLLVLGACSSDDSGDGEAADETTAGTEADAATTTTTPFAGDDHRTIVETLAGDALEGRDNQTPGSEAAQEYLTGLLEEFTEPLPGAPDGYAWPFAEGTNLLGMIPGGERADEVLVLGGHYDHI